MKKLFVSGFLVLMALSPAVAVAMMVKVGGKSSNMRRPIRQQLERYVDKNGEEYFCAPDTRGKAIVLMQPLNEDAYEAYITREQEQDLAHHLALDRPVVELDTENLEYVQLSEQEWQWREKPRKDIAAAQGEAEVQDGGAQERKD